MASAEALTRLLVLVQGTKDEEKVRRARDRAVSREVEARRVDFAQVMESTPTPRDDW